MYSGRTVFAQLMDHFPLSRFHACVKRYNGNARIRRFSCLDQFRVMAFAQLTYRESLYRSGLKFPIFVRVFLPAGTPAAITLLRNHAVSLDMA